MAERSNLPSNLRPYVFLFQELIADNDEKVLEQLSKAGGAVGIEASALKAIFVV